MTVLSDFIPISILFKLLFGQCSMCTNILQVHFPTSPAAHLLRCLTTQKTDRQYIYYAKNVKRCLPRETICVEHDTLMDLRVSSSHGNNLSARQLANNCRCNIQITKCFIYNGQSSRSSVCYCVIRHIDYRATVEHLYCREFIR